MRRPGNSNPIMLKVSLPPFCSSVLTGLFLQVTITGIIGEGATKAMRFDNGTTVREALRIIAEKSNLREADMNGLEEQYVLYKPKTQFEGTILENYSSYLTANDLTDNVRYLVI